MPSCLARALVCLALAAPAAAEVYRWVDARGQLHFSQSLDRVPAAQRAAALAASQQAPEVALQTYRSEAPGAAAAPAARAGRAEPLRVPFARRGGVMLVSARIDDRIELPCLVDTGASSVSLPRAAVEALGIPIGPETPRVLVGTANGTIRVPVVRLESVQLGGARVEDLEAHVSDSMQVGLLGGAFFNHFVYAVDAAAGVLTLTPNEGLRGGLDEGEWRERFRALRDSLAQLEGHLDSREITRPARRAELEARREELRAQLAELEREATLREVPAAWRDPEGLR